MQLLLLHLPKTTQQSQFLGVMEHVTINWQLVEPPEGNAPEWRIVDKGELGKTQILREAFALFIAFWQKQYQPKGIAFHIVDYREQYQQLLTEGVLFLDAEKQRQADSQRTLKALKAFIPGHEEALDKIFNEERGTL